MNKNTRVLKIDVEFQTLIRPLKRKEFLQLEENILSDGCHDPIILWNGIIVDGHNRYEICSKHNIPFETINKEFSCREEVIAWICKNQLGRRNISEESRKYLIGRQYESEKIVNSTKNPAGKNQYSIPPEDDLPSTYTYTNDCSRHKTAQRIGDENHITHATVQKYSNYSKAIETIKKYEPELASKILSGRYKISHNNLVAISQLSPSDMKRISKRIEDNKVPFVQYKRTRYILDNSSRQNNQTISNTALQPSIKDMPEFDPDAPLNELALTIPMWISSIGRMKNNIDIKLVSLNAKSKLTRILQDLENKIVDVLYFLALEDNE